MTCGRGAIAGVAVTGAERSAATVYRARAACRRGRSDHVEKGELVDRLAVESARADEPLRELAADHAGGAGDENVHVRSSALMREAQLLIVSRSSSWQLP